MRLAGVTPLPDAEALLEPLHLARAPHVQVAGARRQRGAHALPARRHLQRRGDGAGAARRRRRPTRTIRARAHSLLVFGHGDGGGGPTRGDARAAAAGARPRRAAAGRGARRRMAFFDDLEADASDLRTVVGELYFEYHRGTYTSQAAVKRGNRRGGACAARRRAARRAAGRRGAAKAELDRLWRVAAAQPVPRHPARHEHHRGQRAGARGPRRGGARAPRRDRGRARRAATCPCQHGRRPRAARWSSDRPAGSSCARAARAAARGRSSSRGDAVRAERAATARVRARERAPARGGRRRRRAAQPGGPRDRARGARRAGQPARALRGRPDRLGRVGRRPGAPRDPRGLPAGAGHRRGARATRCAPRSSSSGGRRALALRQVVRLDAGARRLEFHTEVDWQEDHRFLKVAFPFAVHADEATYEVAFGAVRRPTHYSTDRDLARYEVPGHRWADLAEHGFGVARPDRLHVRLQRVRRHAAALAAARAAAARTRRPTAAGTRSPTPSSPTPAPGRTRASWARRPRSTAACAGRPASRRGPLGDDRRRRARARHGQARRGRRRARRCASTSRTAAAAGARVRARPAGAVGAQRANLLEEPLRRRRRRDGAIVVPFRPWEIVTLRVLPSGASSALGSSLNP